MATKQSAVIYKNCALIPAPLVSLARTTHRSEDGHGVGHSMTATLTGKLVSCKGWDFSDSDVKYYTSGGYPADDTDCCKFDNILTMQDRVRQLFRIDNEYSWFEIQSLENTSHTSHKWLARVQDVQFKEGLWVETAEYVITLELVNSAQEFGSNDLARKMSHTQHSEKWDLQFKNDEAGVYQLTHTISCNAKQFADQPSAGSLVEDWGEANGPSTIPEEGEGIIDGWKEAKRWVRERLVYLDAHGTIQPKLDDEVVFDYGFLLNQYVPYNYTKNENIDQLGGNYSVTETWIMSKWPVYYNVTAEYDKPRDGDYVIKVRGNFKSFLNAAKDNGVDCMTAFKAWEAAQEPFKLAQSIYTGVRTLNSCPVNRVVVENRQYRMTTLTTVPSDEFEATTSREYLPDQTRNVEFTLEYSDGGDALCDSDITVTEKFSNIAQQEMCAHTITIEGTIQGHRCKDDDPNESLKNAEDCLRLLNQGKDLAKAIYTGSKPIDSLKLITVSIGKNSRKGYIHFTWEYTDSFTDSLRKEQTVTESWECERRGSDKKPLYTLQVEGNIIALCDVDDFSILVAAIPAPSTFQTEEYQTDNGLHGKACIQTRQSINKDELHKKVGYSYTFEEDCGLAKIEIDVTSKIGPDKCGITTLIIQTQITGNGCEDAIALKNAQGAFADIGPKIRALDAGTMNGTYVDYCLVSSSVVQNSRGKITASYEFSTGYPKGQCVEAGLTVTESYDAECGIKKTQMSGHIKGFCGTDNAGGAFQAALGYYNHNYAGINIQQYCDGYITARSKTENKLDGTIAFTAECQLRPHPYIEEKDIAVKYDVEQEATIVIISGSITPLCIEGQVANDNPDITPEQAAQVAAGKAAWATIGSTLAALAGQAGDCDNPELRRSSVTISQINGKVQYSMEYWCMKCRRWVPGAIDQSLDLTCNIGGQAIAIIPILGRYCGPIMQNKGTRKESTYTVNITMRFKPDCCKLVAPAGINGAVADIMRQTAESCGRPAGCTPVNIHTISDVISWSPCTGRYTRQITQLMEYC